MGGTSNKYKKPSIFKYADLEFHFERGEDICVSFTLKSEKELDAKFPGAFYVTDWEVSLGSKFSDVERYLLENDIPVNRIVNDNVVLMMGMSSGVKIYFDEDREIYSYYSG